MGCWDIFCFICGNTCHGPFNNSKDYLHNENNITYINPAKIFGNKTNWLNECTFLTANNEILHNAKEIQCNIYFYHNKKNYIHGISNLYYNTTMEQMDNYGLFVHTDCWKFVKNKYNIKLKYGDLFLKFKNKDNQILNLNYGEIKKYWSQDFKFDELILDNNNYMCLSPLKNKENANRIIKIISQLKLKSNRKSPTNSASFYSNKTIKVGNDKNFWIISNNKWIKMKGEILTKQIILSLKDKNDIKILKNFVQIGETNKKPLFVNSFEINKNKIKLTISFIET